MRNLGKVPYGTWVLGLVLLATSCFAVVAEDKKVDLKPGDVAPVFEGLDDNGKPWKSSDFVGRKYVVLYFYPGDFTPGCMKQAQNFRDSMNKLTEKGVLVVGVSGDSLKTHQLFKQSQKLNFTLLTDEEGSLAQQFGVPVGKGGEVKTKDADGQPVALTRKATFNRWTFVIGKDGKIASKNTKANPGTDSKEVAELIDKLEKQ